MGTYLAVGIVSKVVIYKVKIKNLNLTIDLISEQLNKELNINYYNFNEDLEKYFWEIKPHILENNLVEFLSKQFQAYNFERNEYFKETIEELTKVKNFSEIMELAVSRRLEHFQLLAPIFDYLPINCKGFKEDIYVLYDLIGYFIDGKIIMECYVDLFRYLEYNIRLQRNKYPIVDCVKIMITS